MAINKSVRHIIAKDNEQTYLPNIFHHKNGKVKQN